MNELKYEHSLEDAVQAVSEGLEVATTRSRWAFDSVKDTLHDVIDMEDCDPIGGKLARKNTKQATALLGDALVKEIKNEL